MQYTNLLPIPQQSELDKSFAKIKPPLSSNEAVIEASRCLFCHDAPCISACPTSIDIPMFIRQIMSKNIKGAAKTILSQNILGKSCAYVCPTKALCEGSCVYIEQNKKPIEIGRLQGFATDYAIDNNIYFFKAGMPTEKKIAVIGSGPCGLACAHELTKLGHKVIVYEANEKAGGLNTYGVAPYKFTNEDSQKEVEYIKHIGFEIKTNYKVVSNDKEKSSTGNYITISELEKSYDAIFIAIGLGSSKKPKLKGENLSSVIGAIEFIHKLREKEQKIKVGKNVIVIGAGNTAIDAAVESAKLGADVIVVYRRSEKEQSAYSFEIELAKKSGVKFMYLTSPIEIVGNGEVEGIKCIKNKLINKNGVKKPEVAPINGSEFIIPCNMVITAIGQESAFDFLSSIPKLEIKGSIVVVNKDYQTKNLKYFAGGDCINGGKEVVNAVQHGRDGARGIHKFLMEHKNG